MINHGRHQRDPYYTDKELKQSEIKNTIPKIWNNLDGMTTQTDEAEE